jgi:hypothetical protein
MQAMERRGRKMITIRDIDFNVVNTSRNLRGILEYTRAHGVERVDIWPGKDKGAQFGITWNNGASTMSDFASATVCQQFFAKRARFAPWVILHPVKGV